MTAPQAELSLRWQWLNALKASPPTDPRWKPTALALAVALWSFASDDGGGIYPGDARLAAMAGCSVRQVERSRGVVLKLGLIDRVSSATSKGSAAVYRLVSPDQWEAHEDRQPDPEPEPLPESGCLFSLDTKRCIRRSGHKGDHFAG